MTPPPSRKETLFGRNNVCTTNQEIRLSNLRRKSSLTLCSNIRFHFMLLSAILKRTKEVNVTTHGADMFNIYLYVKVVAITTQ